MKCTVLTSLIVLVVMLACPIGLIKNTEAATTDVAATVSGITENKSSPSACEYKEFSVLIDGKTTTLSRKDYIRGVVAAEMPALYETEALKAQAVAAYTFACYRAEGRKGLDYDVTADSQTDQGYVSDAAAREKWGEKAEEYLDKIDRAVSDVEGQLITYNGECALAVYHAMSSGTTTACRDAWGKDIPYLVEVSSTGDKINEKYISTAEFTGDELAQKLSAYATASSDAKNWFKNITVADSKRVVSLEFCGKELSGSTVSKALSLRSSNFSIEYNGEKFVFTVLGYGHGVGMSQTGANYMAQQGSSYKEILMHYYKGCEIKALSIK